MAAVYPPKQVHQAPKYGGTAGVTSIGIIAAAPALASQTDPARARRAHPGAQRGARATPGASPPAPSFAMADDAASAPPPTAASRTKGGGDGFSLRASKELALTKMAEEPTPRFRAATRTEGVDRFLMATLGYMRAHLRRLRARKELEVATDDSADAAAAAGTAAARGGAAGAESEVDAALSASATASSTSVSKPGAAEPAEIAQKRAEVSAAEEACAEGMRGVASAYALLLVAHSSKHENAAAERVFYEHLLSFTAEVMRTVWDHRHWLQVDNELGRIFRSDHFNLSNRRAQGERRLIPARELHALRTSADAFMQQSASAAMPQRRAVHSVVSERSPVMTSLFPNAKERLRLAQIQHDKALAAARRRSARKAAQRGLPPAAARGARHSPAGGAQPGGAPVYADGSALAVSVGADEDGAPPADGSRGGAGGQLSPAEAAEAAARQLVDALDDDLGGDVGETLDEQLEREFYANPFDVTPGADEAHHAAHQS